MIIGFLQGMWWSAVPFLAASTVLVAHLSDIHSARVQAEVLLSSAGYALGVIAAILLMVSWSPAVGRRRAPPIGVLPVMLLGAVGLSQIAAFIFYVTVGLQIGSFLTLYCYILGSAGVPVGLAVTWYAMRLRAHALGGSLVLGWMTIVALWLINEITNLSPAGALLFWVVLACVLLAIAVVLTILYMRGPSNPDGSPSQ